jgi:hypothetical protein
MSLLRLAVFQLTTGQRVKEAAFVGEAFAESAIPFLDLTANQIELSNRIVERARPVFNALGIANLGRSVRNGRLVGVAEVRCVINLLDLRGTSPGANRKRLRERALSCPSGSIQRHLMADRNRRASLSSSSLFPSEWVMDLAT